jgi:hypothetical protein
MDQGFTPMDAAKLWFFYERTKFFYFFFDLMAKKGIFFDFPLKKGR